MLALDCETTTKNEGHVYDPDNKLVCWSFASDPKTSTAEMFFDPSRIQEQIDIADMLVGFNFKFDLAWFLRVGVKIDKPIWDVQIADFVLEGYSNPYPSLNQVCEKYGLPTKIDVVKEQYWDKGIDTDAIPESVLLEYAAHDAWITYLAAEHQLKIATPEQIRLIKLMGQDMLILQEMESNGIKYDESLCEQREIEVDKKISSITEKLSRIYPDVPINWNSGDHLSAFLYGGVVYEDVKILDGFFKTGAKAGQPKYRNSTVEHQLPRLFTPLKGSELKKEGMYATDEGTLKKLKGKAKWAVDLLLELAKLEKLNGTYYKGIPKLNKKMNWEPGILHGQFNQTTAKTGRLSSSRPNLQNIAFELQDIIVSQYNE